MKYFLQNVVVEKFPFNKSFTIELTEFMVEANRDVVLNLTWTPTEGGNAREVVLFKVDGVFRLQAVLLGMAVEPHKKKKVAHILYIYIYLYIISI